MLSMFVQRMKEKAYNYLVNGDPRVYQQYKTYRRENYGASKFTRWICLLKWTLLYRVLKRGMNNQNLIGDVGLYQEQSESEQAKRESWKALAEKLSNYDIVSFDVFDTLLFRPVNEPSYLFFFVGEKLNYLNFEQIRIDMEEKARKLKHDTLGTREVTLDEIWQQLEEDAGICKNKGIRVELETEKSMCFVNPYMQLVLQELHSRGKRIIGISDMYLSKEQIKEMLSVAKVPDVFENIYVSSEYGVSKSDGGLYNLVKEQLGADKSYAHTGDNKFSDVEQAKRHGFTPYFYQNVNHIGGKHRPKDMSVMVGSIYSGLVNSYIHNGIGKYSKLYELGFIYGGLFVLGYCSWIHDYVQNKNVDKILFLARDGDIIGKVYNRLFGGNTGSPQLQYAYWSRLAGTKMCASYYKHDYYKRFLYQKINQGYSLDQVFASMDLSHLLKDFPGECKKYNGNSKLTEDNVEEVKRYFQKNWRKVLKHYEEQIEAGKRYYQKILRDSTRVVVVDVGWVGSGAVQLNHFVNHVWKFDCEVIGLIAGVNALQSDEPNSSEALLYKGKLESYMFSQSFNRELWRSHNPGARHNVIVELLLASEEKSLRRFMKEPSSFEFSTSNEGEVAKEVQRGILDFTDYYLERMKTVSRIGGWDAYAPILTLIRHVDMVKKIIGKPFKMNVD